MTTDVAAHFPSEALIYGNGGFARSMIEACRGLPFRVLATIDVRGHEVNSMTISEAARKYPNQAVLLGVFSPGPDVHDIQGKLSAEGFSELISPATFGCFLGQHGRRFEHYWLTNDPHYPDQLDQNIEQLELLFSDEQSRTLLDQVITFRKTRSLQHSPRPTALADQYVGKRFGFLNLLKPGTIIDCGALDGDSIRTWEAALPATHLNIVALEPEPHSFSKLKSFAFRARSAVTPLQVGVALEDGKFRLEGQGPMARLLKDPLGTTHCTTIDALGRDMRVSMIKMDIEGGELDAIRGSAKIIQRDRPLLAISIYHRPSDLWEIPFQIKRINPNYKFYLDVYGHQGYDLVLYAA